MRIAAKRILPFFLALSAAVPAHAYASESESILFYDSLNPVGRQDRGSVRFIPSGGPFGRPADLATRSGRIRWLRHYVRKSLKAEIREFLASDRWQGLRESSCRSWAPLSRIPLPELLEDIRNSPYVFRRDCRDYAGVSREAVGRMNVRNDEVCFDLGRIADGIDAWHDHLVKSKLIAIAVHESLHHFGYWDADHRILRQLESRVSVAKASELPPPHRIRVSSKFKQLRDEFREGRLPVPPRDGRTTELSCRPLEASPDEATRGKRAHFQALETYFETPMRVSASYLDQDRLAVSHGSEIAFSRELGRKRPTFALANRVSEIWLFDAFAVFPPGTNQDPHLLLVPAAREVAPGRIVLEWLDGLAGRGVPDGEPPGSRLPSAIIPGGVVAGYMDCAYR